MLGFLSLLCAAPPAAAQKQGWIADESPVRVLAAPMQVGERRVRFIKLLLPLLQDANRQIVKERRLLLAFAERREEGGELNDAERAWLAAMAARYGAGADNIEDLLQRVDVVPPSLALGQAALESGWGTSRSAQASDALFGEMARNGRRPRRFQSPAHSVRSYIAILNTHPAYGDFRRARAAARRSGRALDSLALAAGLQRYSVLGQTYVRHVQAMIRANALQSFDDPLDGPVPSAVAELPKPAPGDPPL